MYVVILGAGPDQLPLIEIAHRIGYQTIVVDQDAEKLTAVESEVTICRSIWEAAEVWYAVKDYPFCSVLNRASGPACLTSAYLTEAKGLPGIPLDSARVLTNKNRLADFCAWMPQETTELPCVVKPAFYTGGGKGVEVCWDAIEFFFALTEATRLSFDGKARVEELIEEADDVTMVGVVSQGDYYALALLDGKSRSSMYEGTSVEREMLGIADELIRVFGIERCPLNLDCRVNERVYLLEAHLELAGDGIFELWPERLETAVRLLSL